MPQEIKPCPHCSHPEPTFVLIQKNNYVHCAMCRLRGPVFKSKVEAITAWNELSGLRSLLLDLANIVEERAPATGLHQDVSDVLTAVWKAVGE